MNFIYREVLPEPTEADPSEPIVPDPSGDPADPGAEPDPGGDPDPGTEPDPGSGTDPDSDATDGAAAQPEPRLYAGTAGHCVTGVGARVSNADGPFGTVAFSVLTDDDDSFDDVAFVEIDRSKEHLVNPKMLGFNGPTGVISGNEARPGDTVHVYGYGMVVGETELTRPRSGSLNYSDSNYYGATLPAVFGDSGGPVLHESGAALGIVDHLVVSTDLTTLDGNTVERALELASQAGLELELVTING